MSIIGWVILVVLGINFVLMGSMILWLLWKERKGGKHEQR